MNPLLILSLLFLSASSFAQQVSNVKATQQGANVIITYDLGGNPNSAYYINLLMSKNGQEFGQPLRQIIGDVGNAKPGSNKQIIWNAEKELSFYNGNAIFRVEATSLAAPMPEPVEDELGKLTIISAKQTGSKITIKFTYTALRDAKASVLRYSDETYLIDGEGNKYGQDGGSFGNARIGDSTELVSELATQSKLIFDNILTSNSKIPKITIKIYSNGRHTYSFKNIPISK